MFTGLIRAVGRILSRESRGGDVALCLHTGELPLDDVQLGESIAVSGVCLTVVSFDRIERAFIADVSNETLSLTTLGALPSRPDTSTSLSIIFRESSNQ